MSPAITRSAPSSSTRLAPVAFQAGTGLFANDDVFSEGPLGKLLSDDTSDWLSELHETSFWVLVAVIAVHVAANTLHEVVFRQPLIQAMVTGVRPLPADQRSPRLRPVWCALPVLAVAVLIVCYVVTKL